MPLGATIGPLTLWDTVPHLLNWVRLLLSLYLRMRMIHLCLRYSYVFSPRNY